MKPAKKVAFGGICTALAVVILLFSTVLPTMEYSIPAIAGLMLVPLVAEFGIRYALLGWGAASILGLLLVPNREAAVLFVCFFGIYPILKAKLETQHNPVLEWIGKFLIFNACVLVSYWLLIWVLGMGELMAELSAFTYGPLLLLLLGNVVFGLYDLALSRLITLYFRRIHPHL